MTVRILKVKGRNRLILIDDRNNQAMISIDNTAPLYQYLMDNYSDELEDFKPKSI